jgi:hypothetical protein
MRFAISIFVVTIILSSLSIAQEVYQDVVYLKNGGIMRGTIIELIPEQSVKIKTSDGNVYVYAMSEIEKINKENVSKLIDLEVEKNNIESWYLYFALGYGEAYYPGILQEMMDRLSSIPEVSHVSISLEIPGIYWPLHNNKTILGMSLNGIADRYEVSGNSMQINQYFISFSSMHFLTGDIGDGLYIRGDAGLAWMNVQNSSGSSANSEAGYGLLVGGGYSLPVSNETRLTFNINYGIRQIESESYGALSINLGVLL